MVERQNELWKLYITMLIKPCLFNLSRIFQVSYKLQLIPTSEICNFQEDQTASQVHKYRFSSLDLVTWVEKFLSWKGFWRKLLNCKCWVQIEAKDNSGAELIYLKMSLTSDLCCQSHILTYLKRDLRFRADWVGNIDLHWACQTLHFVELFPHKNKIILFGFEILVRRHIKSHR